MASKICVGAFAATASLSLFGCNSDDGPTTTDKPMPTKTIAELVVGDSDLSALGAALTTANLVSTFNTTDDEFTVFAPTNDAFYKLNGTVNCLLNVPSAMDSLTKLLEYHVIAKAAVQAKDLKPDQSVASLEGAKLNITVDDGTVTVNGDATVTQADIEASDGVVHVINAVLVPPGFDASMCPEKNIAETAGAAGLTNLTAALGAADLVPTFNTVDLGVVYTVFAPTDDAFAALPAGILECALNPDNKDALTELLTYHVAQGYVFSSQLKDGPIPTLDTAAVNVTIDAGTVMINDATVITPNVTTSNGIVHVIDKVLVPPGWACPKSSSTVMV